MKFSFIKIFKSSQSLFFNYVSDYEIHFRLYLSSLTTFIVISFLSSLDLAYDTFRNMHMYKHAMLLILVILSLEVLITLLGHFSLNATFPHLLLLLVFPRGGPCTFPDTICSHLAQMIVSAA